ncbi:MAG: S26 family signal peptidase, partial [Pirellulales bacterium]
PVSLSDWRPRGDFRPAREELDAVCVNCREPLRIETTAEMLPGDRFILDKTAAPARWSMVAFRKPPERTEIYLQRLVGLGGEHLELARGEVFIDGKLLRKEPYIATDFWIPLHNTDRVPKRMHDGTPRWRPRDEKRGWHQLGSGWAAEAAGDEQHSLVFDGAITDALAYNPDWGSRQYVREHVLGDILVTCTIGSVAGVGSIRFDWAFGNSTASAEISVSGEVVIQAAASDHERARATGRLSGPLSDGDSLAFAVRDGQAYVLKNGSLAALATFGPDDVESFAPPDENSTANCELALSVARASLVLDRITLHRDVYYLGAEEVRAGSLGAVSDTWTLEAGEWFMMGDNSARSYDSRFFGPAQTSDLLGVARWVYWPPERWHEMQ